MTKTFTLLIADRNSHVRELLRREMMADGYEVLVAENSREILKRAFQREPLDLLILDPDLPDAEEAALFQRLQDRIPTLPVILHAFSAEDEKVKTIQHVASVVEKTASSIEQLKRLVAQLVAERRKGTTH